MRSFGSEASILSVLLLSKEIGHYLAAISPPSALVPRPVQSQLSTSIPAGGPVIFRAASPTILPISCRMRRGSSVAADMDSGESPTYGEQEVGAYYEHFGCTCYHPLFVFNQPRPKRAAEWAVCDTVRATLKTTSARPSSIGKDPGS
jgi:hypothetical protein